MKEKLKSLLTKILGYIKKNPQTVDAAIEGFKQAVVNLLAVAAHQDCQCEKHEAALKQAQDAAAAARAEAELARAIADKLATLVSHQ